MARKSRALAGAAFTAVLAHGAGAGADTIAEFYKGRQLSMIIAHEVATGYDIYARTLARHMGRHIPGNPSIVVKHQPGAGIIIAANYLFNAAPKDGSEIGLVADAAAIDALLGTVRTQFDAHKFTWIGSAARSISVCIAWHTVPVRNA